MTVNVGNSPKFTYNCTQAGTKVFQNTFPIGK